MNNFTTKLHEIKIASSNHGISVTDKFENINGKDFLTKLRNMVAGDKNGSHWIRTSLSINNTGQCMSRSNTNTQSVASVLVIDCDKSINASGEEVEGAPEPTIISYILEAHNIAHILHGSYSHYTGGKGNRYRIILISNLPYNHVQLPPTVEAIISLINTELAGLEVDLLAYAKENNTWSQPWYYPRKPKNSEIETLYLEYLDGMLVEVIEPLDLPPIDHMSAQQIKQRQDGQISVIDAL